MMEGEMLSGCSLVIIPDLRLINEGFANYVLTPPARGMAVESPELKAHVQGFVARTCNGQPGPQRSRAIAVLPLRDLPSCI
jgi:hypothetical protein